MVHGLTAYMVGCGPRKYVATPGRVSANSRFSVSFFVYSALTAKPSGVFQTRLLTSPPGDCLAAAFSQASRVLESKSFSDMKHPSSSRFFRAYDAEFKILRFWAQLDIP